MNRTDISTGSRWWVVLGLVLTTACWSSDLTGQDQDGFGPQRNIRRPPPGGNRIDLSEATALLEAAIRSLYVTIEPGKTDVSPNELLAYADLRSLRLYAGALEVAGWALDQVADDYNRFETQGAYRGGRHRAPDVQAQLALERYRACRETVRSLLQRVRTTAVLAEHQISFCDPGVGHQWRHDVLPALRDTIAATDPLFSEDVVYQRYGVPGQQPRVVPAAAGGGIPNEAVEVARNPTYQPYEGQGQGKGRFFEIRAFGGEIHVRGIRYRHHERSFGVLGTSAVREMPVDQIVEPGAPLFIPCNRGRWVDMTDLEIEWEPGARGRKPFGTIELVESSPNDRN
jgi:hypothetical protein